MNSQKLVAAGSRQRAIRSNAVQASEQRYITTTPCSSTSRTAYRTLLKAGQGEPQVKMINGSSISLVAQGMQAWLPHFHLEEGTLSANRFRQP